jgi:serine/threonine-protein kinase RIO1
MARAKLVNKLKPGDVFRDWLVDMAGERLCNKKCEVKVYKVPASHTVCRYDFCGEDYSVFAKFYAEPRGGNRNYDAAKAMENEFRKLKQVEKLIDIPSPLAKRKRFNCVLVTEHVKGRPLSRYIRSEDRLYDRLTVLSKALRRLHEGTRSSYKMKREFANYHKVLGQASMSLNTRSEFFQLLGQWWHRDLCSWSHGCMIHNDANPANYLFSKDQVYALDFESSWEHAHPVHDLGIVAAELKKYFGYNRRDPSRAEPYIGHFLWHYSRGEEDFYRITAALPFFMSLGLLRMARWGGSSDQRAYLFREAEACLRSGLRRS